MSTKARIPNGAKLIIIVLSFFLALTFVRAVTLQADSQEVVFSGSQSIVFPVSVTNPTNSPVIPNFLADGPFTIILPSDNAPIPANDSKSYALQFFPASTFKVGDVYAGQLRVITGDGETALPLTFRMNPAPLFNNPSNLSAPVSPTGFFSFASLFNLSFFSSLSIVDVFLVVIVIVLTVALVARIKNRLIGEEKS